jgi:hypothetical protein
MSDYSSKIIDEMLEKLDDEKLKNIYRLMRIEYIMPELGEVHNMLARTSLSKSEYQPISTKLAEVKVELFKLYQELKDATKPRSA